MDEDSIPDFECQYMEQNGIPDTLPITSKIIINELDTLLIDKVRRYTIKGQLDGN